ncbi:hypothetical protein [Caldivirga sp.]|uniref:hypothetical protein n=1 Tax=Caldivirga sp. TaxID=2080243 RepID=UPI003D0EC2A7
MRRIDIIMTVRRYIETNDINGLLTWLSQVEKEVVDAMKKARQRRERTLSRAVRPVTRSGGLVCFDERDLYWAFSKSTIERMGLN